MAEEEYACIVPLYKDKGDRDYSLNVRDISHLSVLRKIYVYVYTS